MAESVNVKLMLEDFGDDIINWLKHLWKIKGCIISHDYQKKSYDNVKTCSRCEKDKWG